MFFVTVEAKLPSILITEYGMVNAYDRTDALIKAREFFDKQPDKYEILHITAQPVYTSTCHKTVTFIVE